MTEEVKPVRSKRDSDAQWILNAGQCGNTTPENVSATCLRNHSMQWMKYKHLPLDNGPFSSTSHDQQRDIFTGGRVIPHGRHFSLGLAQVQNMFEKRDNVSNPNEISAHDHRHTVEANGYYCDFDGIRLFGKRNVRDIDKRLHYTDSDFLTHYDRKPVTGNYESTFSGAYQAFKPIVPTTYRRFPKLYGEPKTGPTELENNVTKWFGNEMNYTPPTMATEQLGQQQWKFVSAPDRAPRKQWRYTYHSALQ